MTQTRRTGHKKASRPLPMLARQSARGTRRNGVCSPPQARPTRRSRPYSTRTAVWSSDKRLRQGCRAARVRSLPRLHARKAPAHLMKAVRRATPELHRTIHRKARDVAR